MIDRDLAKSWADLQERIWDERKRQLAKWGRQHHHSRETYLAILMEEVGELAKAVLEYPLEVSHQKWQEEAIQVAAVAMAMIQEKGD